MINLNTFTNYFTENDEYNEDDFFLYKKEYSIIERFGVWGILRSYDDPRITKHTIYHNSIEEGIEITWKGTLLNLSIDDDYYKIIK